MSNRLCGSFIKAMKRWSSAKLLRTSEFVYATIAVFALTQGPVFLLWQKSATRVEDLPLPSLGHAYFATFLVVQIPGVVLFSRRVTRVWFSQRVNQALVALVAWLAATTIWSTFARESLPQSVALLTTTTFGAYLALSFSPRRLWTVISMGVFLGVGISWVAIVRLWDGAVNFQYDYWVGIYFNRNSLSPVALIAVIGGAYLLIPHSRLSWKLLVKHLIFCVPIVGVCTLACILLWKSESRTSPVALSAAAAIVLVGLVFRWVLLRIRVLQVFARYSFSIALVASSALLILYVRMIGGITGVVVRLPTLNPREVLWEFSWSGFLKKPWHGWGWMAAWRTPEFFESPAATWASTWRSEWSHNSYFDLLLGGGVVAAVLFLLFVLLATLVRKTDTLRDTAFRQAITFFVLIAATQETFFIGSHFLWAVLVAACVAPTNDHLVVEQKEPENRPA